MNYTVSLEDLASWAPQIEATRSPKGIGPAGKEFAWTYEPGQTLYRLREVEDPVLRFIPGAEKYSIRFEMPVGTKAVVFLHNHPVGDVLPSYEDIETFLKMVEKNKLLRDAIIAGTEGGIVRNYGIMHFTGNEKQTQELLQVAERYYLRRKRHPPERFSSGQYECSDVEMAQIIRRLMDLSEIEFRKTSL